MTWHRFDYDVLHSIVFREGYPGYRPHVKEVHANHGNAVDGEKRYAHVSLKYLNQMPEGSQDRRYLMGMFFRALHQAHALTVRLDVRAAHGPCQMTSCLRILEYPVGAGSAPHTDQDLLTLNLYRDQPDRLVTIGAKTALETQGVPEYHIGELGEIFGLGPALEHYVLPSAAPQHAIVFFALPPRETPLPGPTVGSWLDERMERSRRY